MEKLEISSTKKFENMIQNGVTLIDFNAPWCGPCRSQEPIIKNLTEAFKGRAKIEVINIDNHQNIAAKLGIQSIPTLIVFKKGKELQRLVGLQPESILADAIENALS